MNAPYHKGNVRSDLIKQGIRVLKSEGVGAISLRRLAREVGVVPSAVYNHFENREELLASIAAEGFRRMGKAQRKAFDEGKDFRDALRSLVRKYLVFANQNPDLFDLMHSYEVTDHSKYPDLLEAADASFGHGVSVWYPETPYDPKKSSRDYPKALAFWAACHGLASVVMRHQVTLERYDKQELEDLADEYLDLLLNGLESVFPAEHPDKKV